MKLYKKLFSVFVALTIILSVSGVNVFAATTSQDGLEVTLITDKTDYSSTEDIVATLTVKNTNEIEVTNVSLENIIPDGYKVTDESSLTKEISTLGAGESVSLTVTYVSDTTVPETTKTTENTVPQKNQDKSSIKTGDNNSLVITICLLVLLLSVFSIFIFKKKKSKQLLSLTLVCTLMLSYISVGTINVKASEIKNSINIETSVNINNNFTKIKSVVNYSINKTNTYTVTFVSNGGSEVEKQEVIEGSYAVPPISPVKEGSVFIGWCTSQDLNEKFNFNDITITKDLTLWAKWIEDTNEKDTDSDGLFDVIEYKLGTDIEKADTDGDGLTDYEEINIYKTNPTEKDTDSDKVSDGKEIEIGSNPLIAEEKFNVSAVSCEEDTVKVSVTTELTGEQVETLEVKQYNNNYYFPETMPGYIGGAYNFSVDGKFDSAKIQFEFDKNLLNSDIFDPVIYYFNEDTQLLEELDTTITGNIASANVTHFSKYILLNRKVYENSFEWQDVWDTNGFSGVEIVLVIDDSGSMGGNDYSNQRLTVAKNLIDKLPANSKVGVVKFTYNTSKLTSKLTDNKENAKQYLNSSYFYSSGGTKMYTAVANSFSLFESTDEKTLKMMVVLTDGETDDANMHSSVISTANDNKVKIYTVGLGNSTTYFTNYLEPLANNTSGAFYLASDADQLQTVYDDINKKIDIETDSDNDGIADFYEENMVMFNGIKIKLDKNNPDSDGDGLSDGEEVAELNYKYNDDKTKVIVTGKLLCNPLEVDTDGDGVSDEEELLIETNPNLFDTDGDGLDDGLELSLLYDPLNKDPDGDGILDSQEYSKGTDPYTYNKKWYEHLEDFMYGFICGDFIKDTDSLPVIMGQISSSVIPVVGTFGDIRDVLGNLKNGDYLFAGLSGLGVVPVAGDALKSASKAGKFIVKNIDDVPKIVNLLEFLNKNAPDIVKVLNKSDDFIDAAKALSKADNIKLTRTQMKVVTEAFENAGLSHYLIKTGNSLNIKRVVDIDADVWLEKALKRGNLVDESINKHSLSIGLGQNFPVADRLDNMTLVSTKSLDIAAPSYQKPSKLKHLLEKSYRDDLVTFEDKYMKKYGDRIEWGGTTLYKNQYNGKALEIVLPNTIMTENTLEILQKFQKDSLNDYGIEVWYVLTK